MIERRSRERQQLPHFLPGFILDAKARTPLPSVLANVTGSGLGLVTDREIAKGTGLILVTLRAEIELEVIWCENESGHWRVGLTACDSSMNLEKHFSALWQRCA